MARILFIIAQNNFSDDELFNPREVLKSHEQEIASLTTGMATGMRGREITPDIDIHQALEKVKNDSYDAVLFVGGSGAKAYFDHHAALEIAKIAAQSVKVRALGAICIAPLILAHAGVLKGRSATCWNDDNKAQKGVLQDKGAKFVDRAVVVDGKFVTASGPRAAKEFGEKIQSML